MDSLLGCLEEVDSTCLPSANTVNGTTAIFTVSLDKSPTSSVALSIKSDNPEESSISPQTLTFTPENWNSTHTVTVTGVDDELKDGNQDYHVILGPAQSDDPLFNGSVPKPVMMVNVDDENTLEPLYISIGEGISSSSDTEIWKPVSWIMEARSNQN